MVNITENMDTDVKGERVNHWVTTHVCLLEVPLVNTLESNQRHEDKGIDLRI